MKTYHLFISHSWTYGSQYARLVALLKARPRFRFKDYSVPRDDPIHNPGSEAKLREAIRRQMRSCHVVVVLAGVYATHSKWINVEISLAQQYDKPIVAVAPWASRRISARVREAADEITRWNAGSVVGAIRKVAP